MRILVALVLAASIVTFLPSGAAHHCQDGAAHEDPVLLALTVPAEVPVPEGAPVEAGETYYVGSDLDVEAQAISRVGIWTESGQEDGLQTKGGDCNNTTGNNRHYGSDDEVLSVAIPPESPTVP